MMRGRSCEEGGGEGGEGETGGGMQVAASPVFPGNKSSERQESTALHSFNAASAPVSSSAASLHLPPQEQQEEEEEQEEWRDGGGQGVGEALQYCRKRLRGESRGAATEREEDGRKEVELTKRKTGERGRTERETEEEEEQKGGGSGERRWRRTDGEVRVPAGVSAGRFQCEKFLTAADAEVAARRTAGRVPMDLLPGGLGLREVR